MERESMEFDVVIVGAGQRVYPQPFASCSSPNNKSVRRRFA